MVAGDAGRAAGAIGTVVADVGPAVVAIGVAAVDIGAAVAGTAAVAGAGAQRLLARRWELRLSALRQPVLATSSKMSGMAINMSRNGCGFAEPFRCIEGVTTLTRLSRRRVVNVTIFADISSEIFAR